MFAGHRAPQNVVWSKGGFAIATHDELWRVTVRNELLVQTAKLSRPLGHEAAMGASSASLVVGVGLDDGSIDLFRGMTRLRTIAAKPADGGPLQLQVADNGRSIAVTRSNGTWPERTTVHDVETGAEQAQVEGGNVTFDATGAFVTARGGLYALSSGHRIFEWKEGFYVLGNNGMVPLGKIPHGSEMVAQDYTARAFVKNRAVFAGFGDVFVVDPVSGAVTTHPASCGPKKVKRRSLIDAVHGRVLGVCTDAVLVTDLETGKTERIAGGPFTRSSFPPDLALLPGAETMLVRDIDVWVVDPAARSVTRAPPELDALDELEKRCSGRSMPRVDMPCTTPSLSDDKEHRLAFGTNGVQLTRVADGKTTFALGGQSLPSAFLAPRGAAFDVFDGQPGAPPLYRLGGGAPGAALPRATAKCGAGQQYFHSAIEGGALYTGYAGGRPTACICRDSGCKSLALGAVPLATMLGASADGRALSGAGNSTMTESTLYLYRDGRELAHAKVTGSCDHAVFAGTRLFLSCQPQPLQEAWILELHPQTLAVLGRRVAPLGSVSQLSAGADALLVTAAAEGNVTMVPFDWAVDANAKALATHYLGRTGMVTERDTTLDVFGEAEDVLSNARCWNGERLFGLAACHGELRTHP